MSEIGDRGWAIGELAEASGVSVRALRHYDDIGLLHPTHRTSAGHRRYDRAAAGRLYRIVALRQLGFGLAEVGAVLDAPEGDPGTLLAATAAQHLDALDARLAATTALRPRLAALAGTGPGADPDTTALTLEVTEMTVRLDRITTRTGDAGQTSLARGPRVPKDHARVEALGAVDELNAQVGVALAQPDVVEGHRPLLGRVQQRLFDLGADLAHPTGEGAARPPAVGDDEVAWAEAVVAEVAGALPPLDSFVLPGGGPYAAHLHACRTACRTAERRVVALGPDQHPEALRYLNRLSDLCFVLARAASQGAEVTWQPVGS